MFGTCTLHFTSSTGPRIRLSATPATAAAAHTSRSSGAGAAQLSACAFALAAAVLECVRCSRTLV